jgi:DNA-binding winged helix-turn-helix (wHTH) protein
MGARGWLDRAASTNFLSLIPAAQGWVMNRGLAAKQVSSAGAAQQSVQERATARSRCLCFGTFQLDLQQQQLFKDGLRVKVQGKVYQALVTLIETPGEIVTREALRTRLWPRDPHLNYDANVNTTVNKLRQVLGDTNEQSKYIETIPRKGYSFVAKIEYVDAPLPSARERRNAIWSFARASRFLRADAAKRWFTASVIALVLAAALLGAAITLYSHRSIQPDVVPDPAKRAAPFPSRP